MLRRPSTYRPPGNRRVRSRRGGIAFEMILVLVVLLIATVGIVQFGVFLANAEQVAFAARVGGLKASQVALSPVDGDQAPPEVIDVIQRQLASSCIRWTEIRVEHNVGLAPGATPVVLESASGLPGECPPHDVLDPPLSRTYVRVTVCVPMSEVMPAQLSFFGEQYYGPEKTYEHTAIYRYELVWP
ncbi:MAG: hypothetical protein MUF06_05175 [Pirellulaceae bacterium]|nr:hypothetical protein [Pirellulaceae bacterium]